VVSIAVIDSGSLRVVTDSRLPELATKFKDASTTSDTLEVWTERSDELARTGLAGLPKDVLRSIRCYQRTFLLP